MAIKHFRWFSPDEKKPTHYMSVLVYTNKGNYYFCRYQESGFGFKLMSRIDGEEVLFWGYPPAPPSAVAA